jgi:hypothetical protein
MHGIENQIANAASNRPGQRLAGDSLGGIDT